MSGLRRWAAAGLLLWAQAVAAQTDAAAKPARADLLPTEVVDAFYEAMGRGDRTAVLAQLSADVVIYEQGFAELSRDGYAKGSLANDLTFASVVKREVLKREAWEEGNLAWVLTQALVTGDFGENRLELQNAETLVLRRTDLGWKIVHIHRSAHPRSSEESVPKP